MKEIAVYQLDSFTTEPFAGNPAAVVPDADGLSVGEMQRIAREMNLSETAFIFKQDGEAGQGAFPVRFFTPTVEVDLCGHATLAAFQILAELGRIELREPVTTTFQETKVGVLPVEIYVENGRVTEVMMTQGPPEVIDTISGEAEVASLLGTNALNIKDAPGDIQVVSTGLRDLIVPVRSLETLNSLVPNQNALAAYCERHRLIGVHAFTQETLAEDAAAHCRHFAPAAGIAEEAATGTASGALAAYMALNGLVAPTRPVTRLVFEQGYLMGRPSRIKANLLWRGDVLEKVQVGGAAVRVIGGRLLLP